MKRHFSIFCALVLSVYFNFNFANAQVLKVGTGSAKGTYHAQFSEMKQFCGTELALSPVVSSGAVENLDNLIGNKVNMGFVQSDLLHRKARTDDLSNIKTLVALHPEQLHFVVRNEVRKAGGTLGFGAKEYTLTAIEQLAGLRLAAGGGAIETAKQVKTDSDIGYLIVEVGSSDDALKALSEKKVDAALLVGGQPLGNLSGLGREYSLLAVSAATAEKLKGVYKGARVSYPKMNAAGVPTLAINALLVTRQYTTPAMVSALGRFRACVLSKLDEIKETTGTHPAWQGVSADNKGNWPYYDLPTKK